MGGIVGGYFTATEASAVAVFYTFVLSVLIYREGALKYLGTVVTENKFAILLIINLILLMVGMFMDMTPGVLITAGCSNRLAATPAW